MVFICIPEIRGIKVFKLEVHSFVRVVDLCPGDTSSIHECRLFFLLIVFQFMILSLIWYIILISVLNFIKIALFSAWIYVYWNLTNGLTIFEELFRNYKNNNYPDNIFQTEGLSMQAIASSCMINYKIFKSIICEIKT